GTANAREIKAACFWNQKRWREAHLAAASFVTAHPADPRAELWCARAFQAGLNALKENPPLETEQLLAFFDAIAAKRPDDPEVKKIPWYRGYVLIQAGDYARAYRSLLGVRNPADPMYRHAQYGIALSCWKQAETFIRAKDARRTMDYLTRALQAVERFVDAPVAAVADDKADRQLTDAVAYLANQVARALLDQPTPRTDEVLALVRKLDDSPATRDLRADGRLTLRIEAECMKEGPAQAAVRINDYITGTAGAPVAQAAANIVSRLEKAYDALAAEGKKKEADELAWHILRIYEFLLSYVRKDPGTTPDMEAGIRGRLGQAYMRLDKYADAIAHFQSALTRSARSADLMRGLALACEKTGQFDRAILQWRALAKGLERGSEGWYEAHYERIRCYMAMKEHGQARTLLKYYLQYLHPKDAPESWTEKFKALDVELGKEEPPADTVPPAPAHRDPTDEAP
ncbi:MAG TPA: tetratricopeptide repeat protein, partial [Planctomycetota bacterium]|nr:tetratricopeptide repeat protein [Planctomycetota bacterium]